MPIPMHVDTMLTVFENHPKCLIWIFQFWHFPPIFVLLKLTCLVTLFDSLKWTIFGIFDQLLYTQNINVARFARNVECDFFYGFQTLCTREKFAHCASASSLTTKGGNCPWTCENWELSVGQQRGLPHSSLEINCCCKMSVNASSSILLENCILINTVLPCLQN